MIAGTTRSHAPRSFARIGAQVATVGLLLSTFLQVLLALGVIPITMAWGGTQPVLTAPLRLASVVAALLLGVSAYVIRRRAGLAGGTHPPRAIRVLAWAITTFLALNTLANVGSSSRGEALLFGPLTLVTALACLLVAISRPD